MEDNIIDLQRKVKILNDKNNKMYKEIERLNKELERLNNIIKEAREYIIHPKFIGTKVDVLLDIKHILDKGEDKE